MEKILILFFAALIFAACGTKTVELGNPDFPDKNNIADDDSAVSDSDSMTDQDSDSNIPDNDSAVESDDDMIMPDNDSVIDPDDDTVVDPDDDSVIIPDDDAVAECMTGERKCDNTLDNVLECNAVHAWVSVEDCSAPLKMCVESPADNFFCDDLICEPGVKFCKNEDIYTCNADGKGDTLAQNCTDTQYCNTVSLKCEDMICEPSDTYCDGGQLKKCAANGSSFEVLDDCAINGGTCDNAFEKCVYIASMGGDNASPNNRTGQRGNFFNCTKDATVFEFSQRFNFSGSKTITWAIFESENDSVYNRIFIKNSVLSGTGDSQYSTGSINVQLKSGRKYLFTTSWNGQISFYDNGAVHPVDTVFGESTSGYIGGESMVEQLTNPSPFNLVYNQIIKSF